MIISRLAVGALKSLLPSVKHQHACVAKVLNIPSQTITTGRDYLKFGNLPGRLADTDDDVWLRTPELFVGRFDEISSKHEKDYDLALGMTKDMHKEFTRKKTWISYSHDGDLWTHRTGFIDSELVGLCQFRSGVEFMIQNPITPVKFLITVKNDFIAEKQTFMGETEKVVNIIRKAEPSGIQALFATGGVVMEKIYIRVKDV